MEKVINKMKSHLVHTENYGCHSVHPSVVYGKSPSGAWNMPGGMMIVPKQVTEIESSKK